MKIKFQTIYDGHGKYKYPHDFGGYVEQQYMPDSLKGRIYYKPSKNGKEKNLIRKKFNNKIQGDL